jgi:hypothetical protein
MKEPGIASPSWRITGSTAAYHWFSDFRIPKDIDLFTPAKITSSQTSSCMIDSTWHEAAELIISKNLDPVFVDPNTLYTIKVSHANWDIKWEKTMSDIEFFKSKGCQIDEEIYGALLPVWKRVHGSKHVNLNQPVETFFNDYVQREFDHEWLHEQVAAPNRPMHEKIRPDLSSVWCSRQMFESLAFEDQYLTALEEMIVTAIERSKLNASSTSVDKSKAMHRAHRLLCTSMTTGWFARFLITNQKELLATRKKLWTTKMDSTLSKLMTKDISKDG